MRSCLFVFRGGGGVGFGRFRVMWGPVRREPHQLVFPPFVVCLFICFGLLVLFVGFCFGRFRVIWGLKDSTSSNPFLFCVLFVFWCGGDISFERFLVEPPPPTQTPNNPNPQAMFFQGLFSCVWGRGRHRVKADWDRNKQKQLCFVVSYHLVRLSFICFSFLTFPLKTQNADINIIKPQLIVNSNTQKTDAQNHPSRLAI